ncbi:hypothetical protein [Gordonia hongkongensis]|uniref:hypothetical protein n=1 Tax=Gordonia hongkongensis TaxID=1701090 RepID=UPI003D71469F
MANTKKRTAKTDLHCEHCGAEAQILSTPDARNNEIVDQIEAWNEQHFDCGRPTGEVAIENLAKLIGDASPKYDDMKGWLDSHPRRPSWGVATVYVDDDEAVRQADVSWWSETVDVPLLRYDGRLITHGGEEVFCPAKFRAWLVQGPYNYEPFIASRKLWWTGEEWNRNACLSMTLTEAEQVIATLQGLVDIARAETGDLPRHGQFKDTTTGAAD